MDGWIAAMLCRVNNPALGDRVTRLGGDPRRKLRRADRLVGPALLARRHGICPVHLARTAAAGLLFQNPDDPGSVYVRERVAELGVPAAVRDLCELTSAEEDLAAMIAEAYQDLAGPAE
jgi:mannitol-1-phosphate 5-dehydrogenase